VTLHSAKELEQLFDIVFLNANPSILHNSLQHVGPPIVVETYLYFALKGKLQTFNIRKDLLRDVPRDFDFKAKLFLL
jgi:hypothetical protein